MHCVFMNVSQLSFYYILVPFCLTQSCEEKKKPVS